MKQSYNSLVKRIQQFSITCDVKDENGVVRHFHHGHEYIEIGGLKWATMNVGAEKTTDCGLYFQWGDSQVYTADQVGYEKGKKPFTWKDYEYGDGSGFLGSISMTKYNLTDDKTILDAEDDGVAVNWGGKWRIPTKDEFVALGTAVTTVWTNDYKSTRVEGLVCTAKDGSGAELFFPATGRCYNGSVYHVGLLGFYWSSSLDSSDVQQAYSLLFGNGYVDWQFSNLRFFGFTLRGVAD